MSDIQKAKQALALASDVDVLLAVDYFAGMLLAQANIGPHNLLANMDKGFADLIPFNNVSTLKSCNDENLTETVSISAARLLLFQFANTPETAQLVIESLTNYPDSKKSKKTLKFGLVASLLLIVVATEFEYKGKNIHIHKHPVSTEQIKAVADLLAPAKELVEQAPNY